MVTTDAPPSKMQRLTMVILILTTIAFVLALIPVAGAMIMSPMMFDSGPSTGLWILLGTIWTMPISILASIIGSWVFYKAGKYPIALGLIGLPFAHALVIIGAMVMAQRSFPVS